MLGLVFIVTKAMLKIELALLSMTNALHATDLVNFVRA